MKLLYTQTVSKIQKTYPKLTASYTELYQSDKRTTLILRKSYEVFFA